MNPLSRDPQMQYIKRLVWNHKDRVSGAASPIAEVSKVLFEHIREYVADIVDKKYIGSGKIAILGGIQINVAHHDYFLPEMFTVMDSTGEHDYLTMLRTFDQVLPFLRQNSSSELAKIRKASLEDSA